MNFGKYTIGDRVIYHFNLEPEWSWEILPLTSGMELERSKFMLRNPNKTPTWLEIAYREIALTFGGTTIPMSETDKTPALRPDASVSEVEAFLSIMPQPMVIEIWKKIGEINKDWGPTDPNSL